MCLFMFWMNGVLMWSIVSGKYSLVQVLFFQKESIHSISAVSFAQSVFISILGKLNFKKYWWENIYCSSFRIQQTKYLLKGDQLSHAMLDFCDSCNPYFQYLPQMMVCGLFYRYLWTHVNLTNFVYIHLLLSFYSKHGHQILVVSLCKETPRLNLPIQDHVSKLPTLLTSMFSL